MTQENTSLLTNSIFVNVAETKFVKAYEQRLKRNSLEAALQSKWDSDAHFVCYDSNVRVRKDHSKKLFAQIFALDFDNPNHAPWESEQQVAEWFDTIVKDLKQWYAIYTTRSGGRVVFCLPSPIPVQELGEIYKDFKDFPGVDISCLNWHRLFRLPYVVRPEGPSWEDPFVDLVIAGDIYNGFSVSPTISTDQPGPEVRDLVWEPEG